MIWIILIVILFYFVARPAWRVYKAYRDPQKAMEDFLRRNGFTTAADSASGEAPRREKGRKGGWSAPAPRRKKIDAASGDYARFTELPADPSAPSATTTETSIEIESQTIDVTWEELPPSGN